MDATMARARGTAPAVDPAEEASGPSARRRARAIAARSQRSGARPTADAADRSRRAPTWPSTTRSRPRRSGARGWSRGSQLADYAGVARRARPVPRAVGPARRPGRRRARPTRSWSRPRAVRGCATWLDRLADRAACCERRCRLRLLPGVSEGDDARRARRAEAGRAGSGTRFTFPRQRRDRRLCLADFLRSRDSRTRDGEVGRAAAAAGHDGARRSPTTPTSCSRQRLPRLPGGPRPRRAAHRGAGRVLAPAHPRGADLPAGAAVAAEDPADVEEFFQLGYRGARYSLGYGACPEPRRPHEDRRTAAARAASASHCPRSCSCTPSSPPTRSSPTTRRPSTSMPADPADLVPASPRCPPCRCRRNATFMPRRRRKVAFLTRPGRSRPPCCGTWTGPSSTPSASGRSRCRTPPASSAAR